jgi:hypothetical protein
MNDLITFETSTPRRTYKAYLKEPDKYDLYCGDLLLTLGIKGCDLYVVMRLFNGTKI